MRQQITDLCKKYEKIEDRFNFPQKSSEKTCLFKLIKGSNAGKKCGRKTEYNCLYCKSHKLKTEQLEKEFEENIVILGN